MLVIQIQSPHRLKIRAMKNKSWQRLYPAGGGWGLFGFHTVPEEAKEVVLTEGEFDAMAVYQVGPDVKGRSGRDESGTSAREWAEFTHRALVSCLCI